MSKRKIIKIDNKKCNGCSLCVPNCPEGAIQIIKGKACVVNEFACDGLGACIGECPQGAITIEERQAQEYDEYQVMENIVKAGEGTIKYHLEHLQNHNQKEYLQQAKTFLKEKGIDVSLEQKCLQDKGCPGSKIVDRRNKVEEIQVKEKISSQLRQWPVQLRLLNPVAPYFKDADLIVAADCTAFTYGNFHEEFLKAKTLIIFCPKLDKEKELYLEKLIHILKENNIKSLSIVRMEVPCCFGATKLLQQAVKGSGKEINIKEYIISIKGEILKNKGE